MNRPGILCAAGIGLAAVLAASPTLAQGRLPQQHQGFENTGQDPANYTPTEKTAADVIVKWINTTNSKDLAGHMSLIDDSIAYRADPAEALGREGKRGYCSFYLFIRSSAWVRLDELYVIGGPRDAMALVKRADVNGPPGGGFGGAVVALADLVRVRNGKIVEWYDMPINRVGPSVTVRVTSKAQGENVPEVCQPYTGNVSTPPPGSVPPPRPPGSVPPPIAQPVAQPLNAGLLSYGVSKSEAWFNVEEAQAALAIRGFFAARQANNPQLLAAFVDENATFRASLDGNVLEGRDALLKSICQVMGGTVEFKDLYLIGADFQTTAIARWERKGVDGSASTMASFFRVQKGLITEWMDSAVDGAIPVAEPNSAACRSINATLAKFARLPLPGAAPANPFFAPAAAPAGAPRAGGPPGTAPAGGGAPRAPRP
jgi:hypothetical protein